MPKHSKVRYIQGQKIFQHSAFVTLWFFTYISALRTRNLGSKRSISNPLQMSINVLLLLLLKLLLLIVLRMLYFYFATFTTCPLLAYKQMPHIHTLFHGLFYC